MRAAKQLETKKCGKCGVVLTAENQVNHPSWIRCKTCASEQKKIVSRKYGASHQEERAAYDKKWRVSNPEKMKGYNQKYRKRKNLQQQVRRAMYPERYRAKDKKYREFLRSSNPYRHWAISVMRSHKRRKKFIIQITINELEALARATPTCLICGRLFDWENRTDKPHMDRPSLDRINNGILLRIDTVQIICGRCNFTKCDMPMRDFILYCKMVAAKFAKYLEVN